ADTSGVDEPPGTTLELDELVDRVPGRAGRVVDDDTLAPRHLVEERRLTDVGTTDERDATRPVGPGDAVLRLERKLAHRGVEKVARAAPVERGDGVRLTEPEAPQRGRIGLAARTVDLVRRQDDRFASPAQ